MSKRRLTNLLFTLILIIGFSIYNKYAPVTTPTTVLKPTPTIVSQAIQKDTVLGTSEKGSRQMAHVVKVVDGDTIEIEGGVKVRYIGINTPETHHPTKGVECFGKEASLENKKLVEGKDIIMEKDVSETDRYGRLLRFIYLPASGSAEMVFVNDYLVKSGFAFATTYPPDVNYADVFRASEAEARKIIGDYGMLANSQKIYYSR